MAHLIHSVLPRPPRKIACINQNETLKKCMDVMTSLNIGALVVLGDTDQLLGIISERDILSCIHKGKDVKTATASDAVYTQITILSPDDLVEKAMKAMTDTRRRHILIREKDELVAILSIGDLLYHLLEDKSREIEHLEHYIYT